MADFPAGTSFTYCDRDVDFDNRVYSIPFGRDLGGALAAARRFPLDAWVVAEHPDLGEVAFAPGAEDEGAERMRRRAERAHATPEAAVAAG